MRLVTLIVLAGFLAAPSLVRGAEVQAEGAAAILGGNIASARNQALLNAQRNAVEQGVGLVLDSKTASQNFQVIKDEILTSSQGYVTRYTVVSEGQSPDRSTFNVKIKAEVAQNLLEDKLSALRILHKKMGNKRVMVVYQSDNPNALKRNHGAATAALLAIQGELNTAGFRVFDERATQKVYEQIERAAKANQAVDEMLAMAMEQQADIIVRLENIAGQRAPQGGLQGGPFSAAYATIRAVVYDANTGRQISDAQVDGKQLLRANAGAYDWEKGLADASSKAAREAGVETIGKIAEYYKRVGDTGFAYLIVFKGYSDDEKDTIVDFLEKTPSFRQMSELKNAKEYLEVELFSGEEGSRLRRIIRAGLQEKGIKLQIHSSAGNRIMFSNPAKAQ